jgi:hypothetical protein
MIFNTREHPRLFCLGHTGIYFKSPSSRLCYFFLTGLIRVQNPTALLFFGSRVYYYLLLLLKPGHSPALARLFILFFPAPARVNPPKKNPHKKLEQNQLSRLFIMCCFIVL